jgi:hypothetical protein
MVRRVPVFACLLALAAVGCGPKSQTVSKSTAPEPDYITVQHILIAFNGSVEGKNITRSKEEAKALAEDIFRRAKAGEDFDSLVEQYSDDSAPGVYGLANNGVEPDPDRFIYARSHMVPAFGDVGFALAVGEIGLAPYDKSKSKYGWHIIKRIK